MSFNKFLLVLLVISSQMFSAYLENIPMEIVQPNGTKINCFATGDEFFNRLHDENDFSIIQDKDGWYYYGIKSNGNVIPSDIIVGSIDPKSAGIEKRAVISAENYKKRVEKFNNYPKGKDAPTIGTIENVVIFIRFADEREEEGFGEPRSYYDNYFNTPEGPSLHHYFKEVSYNKLTVNSTYYPVTTDHTYNLSFQDIYNRSYYQPYNATTNTEGYEGGDDGSERTAREHALLERAVVAVESEIPPRLAIDGDNDGYVDNVVFLISGMPGAWASLLWPHRWSLYSTTVQIHGKTVGDYNFDMTGSSSYFHTGVICHEFFHSLGAPDLYHYYDASAPDAVGAWDVMNQTSNPPQYMGAFMKFKYGDWIDTIPVISKYGEYTLNPLTQPDNNIFRINSPNSTTEYFIVEYRKQEGLYETSLPGSDDGMLIYRINSSAGDGNAGGPPDEVYIYRPNGTSTSTGILSNVQFSADLGRTEFNSNSNPTTFLYSGLDGGVNIYNIGTAGETITFSYGMSTNPPQQLVASTGIDKIELNWISPEVDGGLILDHFKIFRDDVEIATTSELTYFDVDVSEGSTYSYKVSAYYTGEQTGESQPSDSFIVNYDRPKSLPFEEDFVDTTIWSQFYINCTPRWVIKNTTVAGGTLPELYTTYAEIDANPAIGRYVTPPLSTTGIDTLKVGFKHLYDAFEPGLAISLEMSSNMFDWLPTGFYYDVGATNIGPEEITLFLTDLPNPLYLSWTIEGNLYNVDGWSVDDVYVVGQDTSIDEISIPAMTELIGNYPNPFNPVTDISFNLERGSNVRISVFNENGSLVDTITNSYIEKGRHSVKWNAAEHATGLYFISMEANNYRGNLKTLLIK
ncbi:MAG: M6 family metalloprotease domain-containing protein [Candidatus Delongbacteria bacterium]|jgi:M6 family metalloprotease-like protein|nr:M6 family metalloprotease domain-containing protein [Candidatus Delongbacteria bacterium]